jgi:hypothetical protein
MHRAARGAVGLPSWCAVLVLGLLAAGCDSSRGTATSGDVVERLLSSEVVVDRDAATCRAALPDEVAPTKAPPVLSTDTTTYAEVADAISDHGHSDVLLSSIPQLSADTPVTLCLLDARALSFAPFKRSVLAVSGDHFWWAGGCAGRYRHLCRHP